MPVLLHAETAGAAASLAETAAHQSLRARWLGEDGRGAALTRRSLLVFEVNASFPPCLPILLPSGLRGQMLPSLLACLSCCRGPTGSVGRRLHSHAFHVPCAQGAARSPGVGTNGVPTDSAHDDCAALLKLALGVSRTALPGAQRDQAGLLALTLALGPPTLHSDTNRTAAHSRAVRSLLGLLLGGQSAAAGGEEANAGFRLLMATSMEAHCEPPQTLRTLTSATQEQLSTPRQCAAGSGAPTLLVILQGGANASEAAAASAWWRRLQGNLERGGGGASTDTCA